MRRLLLSVFSVALIGCAQTPPIEPCPECPPVYTPSRPVVAAPAEASGEPLHAPATVRPEGQFIDVHAHINGYEVWQDAEALMDAEGMAYAINLSGGHPRRGMTLARMLAADAGGRVLNCMNVNWDGIDEEAFGETVADELELLVTRYGYVCLKVSKALGLSVTDGRGDLIPVDDPRLFPLWRRAGALAVPVFIHTSDPAAFWEPVTPENERYAELSAHPSWSFADPGYPSRDTLLAQRDNLLGLFPQTTFIGVHFANNPEDIDYVDGLLSRYPNLYVDVAARLGEIGRHDAERVREVFVRHQDRILFGTDVMVFRQRGQVSYVLGSSGPEPDQAEDVAGFFAAHWAFFETDATDIAHPTPIQGDWTIDAIALPPDVIDKVYYLNAHRLFLERARAAAPLTLPR